MMENPMVEGEKRGERILYDAFGTHFNITARYLPPIRHIGSDRNGVVCSFYDTKRHLEVAVRKITNVFDDNVATQRMLKLLQLLVYWKHKNVIAVLDVIPPLERRADVYITQQMIEVDLADKLKCDGALSMNICQDFLYQMLRALQHIHLTWVRHKDLQPSNILLDGDVLKISFPSFRCTVSSFIKVHEENGRWYRAPEILLNSSEYTDAIDVWSVGCIFMEMMLGRPLLQANNWIHHLHLLIELLGTPKEAEMGFLSEGIRLLIRGFPRYDHHSFQEKFPHLHPTALDLAEKMLTFHPARRITVQDALMHPYLASVYKSEDNPE